MTGRQLAKVLLVYTGALVLAATLVRVWYGIDLAREPTHRTVVSLWQRGDRVARAISDSNPDSLYVAEGQKRGSTVVYERVIDQGRVLTAHKLLFCSSFANGRDGVHARFKGKEVYLTQDDLLKHQAYGTLVDVGAWKIRCGVDADKALELLAREFSATPQAVWDEAEFQRVVFARSVRGTPKPPDSGVRVRIESLRSSITAAAQYLSRNLQRDGTYRYEVLVTTNEPQEGYNWPRHSGATHFLAEAAGRLQKRSLTEAAKRAARRLTEHATLSCGKYKCIGEGDRVDLGSAALALLAYTELVLRGLDDSLKPRVEELAEFLRSMQRPDGEFMHVYDRAANKPVDIQFAYYTGEAALALGRTHRITKNPKDLEAARKALAYTANERWTFFGGRYYFDSEHWTCQALDELWDRAQDHGALEFCLTWHEFNRAMQFDSDDPLGDYDGAFGAEPLLPPRITPAGSRTEGAAATLTTAVRAGVNAKEIARLENQVERALGFAIRHQFSPGRHYLLKNPVMAYGGFPGSPTDWKVRIDFPQHVGSAMIRYMEYLQKKQGGAASAPIR